MSRGRFIVFEGVDGTGKTTLSKHVAKELGALWTREPGASTPFGAHMRELIMTGDQHPSASLFLFGADRQEHLARIVLPALNSGIDVVCDRYIMSTLTYQLEQWDELNLRNVTRASCTVRGEIILPELVVIVESKIHEIIKRLSSRDSDGGRYDSLSRGVIEQRSKRMRDSLKTVKALSLIADKKIAVGCFENSGDLETSKKNCVVAIKTALEIGEASA